MKTLGLFIATALLAIGAHAGGDTYKVHDGNKIFYSTFNSSFIPAEVAAAHDIVRSKKRGLVNIAVVPADQVVGGVQALVKGTVSNLLQQSQQLDFFEVREGDVVYYLASFKFDNKDSLTFKIDVKADPNKPSYRLKFQQTFYRD
ncbi:DUF4426 domain-containing protein [Porticoccus sp. W117]|uniref:DUF4426 domain-containing protein n=1 Tax=Porticoccus sp. W117 TaxID=3054777 RepID=UPI0025961A82|nr:DUF4426 domain-containing protein [Porticoccus sp. W117]MDM3872040.1 DUF4426 domain-containing protein [Porticoccus sp. W117]